MIEKRDERVAWILPLENESDWQNENGCENEAVGNNNPQAHSINGGQFVEHIDPSKCELNNHH